MIHSPLLGFGLRRRVAVRLERARGGELAEAVADHVFGDEDRHVLTAVVDGEREPDEVREGIPYMQPEQPED